MIRVKDVAGAVRLARMVLGGIIGASIGIGGYHNLPQNSDTFGTLFAQGYFLWIAGIGVLVGVALAALIGRSVDGMLELFSAPPHLALGIATVVTVITLVLFRDGVKARYPGFRESADASHRPDSSRRAVISANTSSGQRSSHTACTAPPPTDERELRLWREECR